MEITDKPLVVKKNNDGSEYIPIGHIEQTLDGLYKSWGTSNFRFNVFNIGDKFFANGVVSLKTEDWQGVIEYQEGSGTFPIYANDINTHYGATVLSYCIANAAGRKGIVFGRALNGRLEKGETSLPVIQTEKSSKEFNWEFEETKRLMIEAKTKAKAKVIMNARGFKFMPELQQLLETLK